MSTDSLTVPAQDADVAAAAFEELTGLKWSDIAARGGIVIPVWVEVSAADFAAMVLSEGLGHYIKARAFKHPRKRIEYAADLVGDSVSADIDFMIETPLPEVISRLVSERAAELKPHHQSIVNALGFQADDESHSG